MTGRWSSRAIPPSARRRCCRFAGEEVPNGKVPSAISHQPSAATSHQLELPATSSPFLDHSTPHKKCDYLLSAYSPRLLWHQPPRSKRKTRPCFIPSSSRRPVFPSTSRLRRR